MLGLILNLRIHLFKAANNLRLALQNNRSSPRHLSGMLAPGGLKKTLS